MSNPTRLPEHAPRATRALLSKSPKGDGPLHFIDIDGHGVVHLGGFPEELAIEEVVVTAQKTESARAGGAHSLDRTQWRWPCRDGALDVKDVITRTPGLAGASKDSFVDTLSFRGISTNDFGVGGDPSVAIFQNGVYSGRSGEALSGLYDVERVEVLRCPQGLLFGRSATSWTTENVGKVEGKGVEMELVFSANEHVQFRATGAWQDAEMKEIDLDGYATPSGGSCVGNTLPFSPKVTATGDLGSTYPFGNSMVYFVSEVVYSDDFFVGLENLPVQEVGSWTEWNFRLGVDIGENINVSAFLENAFNEEHFDGSEDLTADLGFAIGFGPARPRTWGVDVPYRFGN